MANNITGSCEIGESVELIPDAVDDILPPGYLDEGTLPIDTTEQDIGVDPAGGMAVTGECAECPPGTTWGCCPDGIAPIGPPRIEICEIVDDSITTAAAPVDTIKLNDGSGDFIQWTPKNGTNTGWIQRMSSDLKTRRWSVNDAYFADASHPVYDTHFPHSLIVLHDNTILLKYFHANDVYAGYMHITNEQGSSPTIINRFICDGLREHILAAVPAPQLMFDMQDGSVFILEFRHNGTRYIATIERRLISDWSLSQYMEYSQLLGTPSDMASVHVVDNNIFLGLSWEQWHPYNASNIYPEGKVHRFALDTGTYVGLFASGSDSRLSYQNISGSVLYNQLGYKIISTDNHILIFSGVADIENRISQATFANIHIFDRSTLALLKVVESPQGMYGETATASSSMLGFGFYDFGDYYYVGEPVTAWNESTWSSISGLGAVYLLDKVTLEIVDDVASFPTTGTNSGSGRNIYVDNTQLISVYNYPDNVSYQRSKICNISF